MTDGRRNAAAGGGQPPVLYWIDKLIKQMSNHFVPFIPVLAPQKHKHSLFSSRNGRLLSSSIWIRFRSVPPPPHFFPIFLLPFGMPIDSEIMDRFWHSRCLNDRIDLFYMIGSFGSGANVSLVAKIGTKDLAISCSVNRI